LGSHQIKEGRKMKIKDLIKAFATTQPKAEIELSAFIRPAGQGYNEFVRYCMAKRVSNQRKRKQRRA
jgi:hypothetical protein